MWMVQKVFWKQVHDSIISVLIGDNHNLIEEIVGLTDLCNGCSDCVKMGESCRGYGPIYPSFLEKYIVPNHFDNLVVGDPFFDFIATKSDSLEEWNLPMISCRNLTIDCAEMKIDLTNLVSSVTQMPLKIVEMMMKKWKVKSVKINSRSMIKDIFNYKHKEIIAPFRLTDPFATTEKSESKLDHVELNLTRSSKCTRGITTEEVEEYRNVIANIRRMFPTDHIKITGVYVQSSTLRELYGVLNCLKETIYHENQ
uniref:DDE Tnp4 domain-containing protein n=2 Tax=Caenorhabditis tropicalis TaxID=1561998 RepID=A0A1I7V4F7_9PELO